MASIHDKARAALSQEDFRRYIDRYDRLQRQSGITWLLWLFLGGFGGHKFYLGNTSWGIVYVFTLALVGTGWLYDLFTMGRQIEAANRRVADRILAEEFPDVL